MSKDAFIRDYKEFGSYYVFKKRILPFLLLLAVTLPLFSYALERYRIIVVDKKQRCLPERVFLIDTFNKSVQRGDFVLFGSPSLMEPVFKLNSNVIKLVAGQPGDHVSITESEVSIQPPSNERKQVWGSLDRLDEVLKKTTLKKENIVRSNSVSEDHIFVIGTLPKTFDSRYWGQLPTEYVEGKAYAIW